jgi:hypothetical protein
LSSLRTIDRYAGTKDGRSICEERFGKWSIDIVQRTDLRTNKHFYL